MWSRGAAASERDPVLRGGGERVLVLPDHGDGRRRALRPGDRRRRADAVRGVDARGGAARRGLVTRTPTASPTSTSSSTTACAAATTSGSGSTSARRRRGGCSGRSPAPASTWRPSWPDGPRDGPGVRRASRSSCFALGVSLYLLLAGTFPTCRHGPGHARAADGPAARRCAREAQRHGRSTCRELHRQLGKERQWPPHLQHAVDGLLWLQTDRIGLSQAREILLHDRGTTEHRRSIFGIPLPRWRALGGDEDEDDDDDDAEPPAALGPKRCPGAAPPPLPPSTE